MNLRDPIPGESCVSKFQFWKEGTDCQIQDKNQQRLADDPGFLPIYWSQNACWSGPMLNGMEIEGVWSTAQSYGITCNTDQIILTAYFDKNCRYEIDTPQGYILERRAAFNENGSLIEQNKCLGLFGYQFTFRIKRYE